MAFLSESDFLDYLSQYFPQNHPNILLGRNDDCNLIPSQGTFCISSDLFLEEIHFSRQYFSPGDIGYKALAVNISDISAMGARPQGFLLNLMIPYDLDTNFWSDFFPAMAQLADKYNLALAGGDLSRSKFLGIDISIWGQKGYRWLKRRKCHPGDALFVIGPIGLARAGRKILERGGDISFFPEAVQAHLRPRLFVDQAIRLGKFPSLRGLMDISDGIVQDLPRFLGSNLGASIMIKNQDIHPEVHEFAHQNGSSPVEFALQGGEDYGLLGCADSDAIPLLKQDFSELLYLGEVKSRPEFTLNGKKYRLNGFDHFSTQS